MALSRSHFTLMPETPYMLRGERCRLIERWHTEIATGRKKRTAVFHSLDRPGMGIAMSWKRLVTLEIKGDAKQIPPTP